MGLDVLSTLFKTWLVLRRKGKVDHFRAMKRRLNTDLVHTHTRQPKSLHIRNFYGIADRREVNQEGEVCLMSDGDCTLCS